MQLFTVLLPYIITTAKSDVAITRNRTFISTGFDTCAFIPASSAFCLSSSKAFAVIATIGTAALEAPNLFRLLCFPYLYVIWKILQNMWKIVFTHPNSSIFNYNLICNIIFPVKRNLPDIYGDLATCRSIFQ